jgi:hypothetical protein
VSTRRGALPEELQARLGDIVREAESKTQDPEPRAKRRPRQKTQDQAFADLDGFADEARAGMPDEALARAAGVALTSVLAWRRARGIKRTSGHLRRRESQISALDAFGDHYDPGLHSTGSAMKGQWEIPQYVLRTPLRYDEMCRQLYFLHVELGSGAELLAKAFGFRERDVEMALAVEVAHLQKHGAPCARCGVPCDPRYGKYCSTRCKETK